MALVSFRQSQCFCEHETRHGGPTYKHYVGKFFILYMIPALLDPVLRRTYNCIYLSLRICPHPHPHPPTLSLFILLPFFLLSILPRNTFSSGIRSYLFGSVSKIATHLPPKIYQTKPINQESIASPWPVTSIYYHLSNSQGNLEAYIA